MNITGMLAIGNGEKCPFCDMIMEKDTDALKHMINEHPKELSKELFDADN